MHRFHYLSYGLGLVLMFVGVKMVIHHFYVIPTTLSLWVVLGLLSLSIGLSLLRSRGVEPEASGRRSETSVD
jgi:tellurite resistance protein TerC